MKTVMTVMVGVAVTVTGVVLVAAMMSSSDGKADGGKEVLRPIAVEVTPVRAGSVAATVSAVGTVAASKDMFVSSETAGRVTGVFVRVGDPVKRGQTLIVVDDELKIIAVDQARAQLMAAETNLGKARNDFQRAEKLFATGDIPDIELEGSKLALRSSEANQKSAEAALRYAQRQLEDTRIKAPIAGVVVSKKVEVGEMVSPGKEVANLVDIRTMKVVLGIPEDQIGLLRVNQTASVLVDSRPGKAIKARVYSIGAKTESPTGHTFPVEIVVDNNIGDDLKVGMFARVEIKVQSASGALMIGKESLVSDGLHPTVFVVEDNIARLRPVTLGLQSDDVFQVVGGLREGELVISFGQKNLKDGSAVQYKTN
jgi:membrane fusion protein, multidrug efflux system